MTFELSQRFFFDAAHTLRRAMATESSLRVHGHTYQAEITLAGQPDPATGMVIDLGLVGLAIEKLRERLDHHLLDEVEGLGIPTLDSLGVRGNGLHTLTEHIEVSSLVERARLMAALVMRLG